MFMNEVRAPRIAQAQEMVAQSWNLALVFFRVKGQFYPEEDQSICLRYQQGSNPVVQADIWRTTLSHMFVPEEVCR